MSIESRWKQIHDFLDVELELYHGLYLHKGQGENRPEKTVCFIGHLILPSWWHSGKCNVWLHSWLHFWIFPQCSAALFTIDLSVSLWKQNLGLYLQLVKGGLGPLLLAPSHIYMKLITAYPKLINWTEWFHFSITNIWPPLKLQHKNC